MQSTLKRDAFLTALASQRWPFKIRRTSTGNLLLRMPFPRRAIVVFRKSHPEIVRFCGHKDIFSQIAAAMQAVPA